MSQTHENIFSQEDIDRMKSILDGKDILSKEEKIKFGPLRSLAIEQDYGLAMLFVKCYDYLLVLQNSLFDEDNDYRGKISEFLQMYKRQYDIARLRDAVQSVTRIQDGIGTFQIKKNLSKESELNRIPFLKLIDVFVKIGGLDE